MYRRGLKPPLKKQPSQKENQGMVAKPLPPKMGMPKPNKDMLKQSEIDGIHKYNLSPEFIQTYLLPFSGIACIDKLIEFDKKSKIYDHRDWLKLLRIPFYFNTYENPRIAGGRKKPPTKTVIELQFAFDQLLKMEGFVDIEARNKETGEIDPHFFSSDGSKDVYYMKNRERYGFKEELYRAMRIFIHTFQNYRRKYHKSLLKLYFEEGLTFKDIGENHYKTRTGENKKVSKVWIFLIINYYRDCLLRHMKTHPELYSLETDGLTETCDLYRDTSLFFNPDDSEIEDYVYELE
jgi:hypothetical protein